MQPVSKTAAALEAGESLTPSDTGASDLRISVRTFACAPSCTFVVIEGLDSLDNTGALSDGFARLEAASGRVAEINVAPSVLERFKMPSTHQWEISRTGQPMLWGRIVEVIPTMPDRTVVLVSGLPLRR
jgi:hypothetical protein